MITITAKINISGDNRGTINSIANNVGGNNVSADINAVLDKQNIKIGNPFILGSSKLGSGAYYVANLPYFMGRRLSDSNGNFAQSYTITISGSNISSAIIVFDKENGEHPNSIIVDGETIYDNDPQFEIAFNSTANSHTIEISNWNTPYKPLIITGIYASLDIEINRKNLMSFNSDITDRGNISKPSYGIISNNANLTFADFDEKALDLITQKVLHSGIEVEVWLNNTDSGKREQICLMETRELSYDNENRQVQLSLKDNLEEWQEINIKKMQLRNTMTAFEIYEYLKSKTPRKYEFVELDNDTEMILKQTTISNPYIEADTLWEQWDKLCQLCLLHIYENNAGKVVVAYDNGN